MRPALMPIATTIVVGLLVVACVSAASPAPTTPPPPSGQPALPSASASASATPSAPPVFTPAPIPTPTSPPAAGGWPYILPFSEPVFGPDGTVYFLAHDAQGAYQRMVIALDAAGDVKPGWSIEAPPGSYFGSLAVAHDGSVYIDECGGPEVGCVLHRLGASGRDLPGWPFEIPSDFACPAGYNTDDPRTPALDDPCYPPGLAVGPNGTAYLTKQRAGDRRLIAIDPAGEVKPGWPIDLDDQGVWWSNVQLGSDSTLFILGLPDGSDSPASLSAFAPDGSPRAGWPVLVPDNSDYLLGPHGTVVVWSLIDLEGELCQIPRRTVFTVLWPDGRTLPGWPRGSEGYASRPVVGADGTVYYASAGHVYAHDRTGEIEAGWPVAVPRAFGDFCGIAAGPHLAPDGTIYVMGEEVTALSPDGRSRPGWPYRPAGQLSWPCLGADCGPYHVAPAFGPDGTVYLVIFQPDPAGARAEVVALERQGQLKPGWPYRLPFDLNSFHVGPLTVSPDGRLFVRGGYLLLALDPDGRISE